MSTASHEPEAHDASTAADITTEVATSAPQAGADPASGFPPPATIRHDGWTGEKMAEFCEVLAETAVVAEACDMVRMSTQSAYKLRRRNPVFAAGWDAALTIARERLADTLLARSIEGNAEFLYRDGELVGRREVIDNRLGLAILGRLDRLAETGRATGRGNSGRGERPAPPPARPVTRARPADWDLVLAALRTRDPDDIAGALAALKSYEVDEVDDPAIQPAGDDEGEQYVDHSDRYWREEEEGVWLTDFPPPPGYDGVESGEFGDPDTSYERECTPAEVAAIEAAHARERAAFTAEEAAERDRWFAFLLTGHDPDDQPPGGPGDA